MIQHTLGPDIPSVLSGLKDFQRDTVDYVFRRLYTDQDATRRFLIADEVGLGKTLVARGIIAKAIDYLWDKVPRIDIIYICSNANIARQNLARLNPTNQEDFALASRITMLPTVISDLARNRMNLISFTPGTSFDLEFGLGRADERAVLYWLLNRAWGMPGTGPMNALQGYMSTENFRWLVSSYKDKIDESLSQDFTKMLDDRIREDKLKGDDDIRTCFEELCGRFSYARKHIPGHDASDRARIVGELRFLLATSCLRSLEPDLIILDEFQRFKHLLEGKDDAGRLAQQLFNYSNENSSARVLLLSATPYKMYTLDQESAEDDHYKDFMRTYRFLQSNGDEANQFEKLLAEYRRELYRLGGNIESHLTDVGRELQTRLRKVMVRTERLAVTQDRNGMLEEICRAEARLEPRDLNYYMTLERVAHALENKGVMEYWKSAPYVLNFMEDYTLKGAFLKAVKQTDQSTMLIEAIANDKTLLLPSKAIREYRAVDPGNARLRCLQDQTIGLGAWRLLWIPPSLPYYQLGGAFANAGMQRFTKRLVFSSWKVVPRVVAALLSYEAERQMICSFEANANNTPEDRKRRRPLLRFAYVDNRPTGMPVLGLIYPCVTLARECDPLRYLSLNFRDIVLPTKDIVLEYFIQHINGLMSQIGYIQAESATEDEAWYWAAPIILDLVNHKQETLAWFGQRRLATIWAGEDGMQEDEDSKTHWATHVEQALKLVSGELSLGRFPKDLAFVLAQMALAGPGITALRALSRVIGGEEGLIAQSSRNEAARIARSFLTLFNLPESMALLRGMNSDEPYWRRVLEYCVDGGLQPTLDEYIHVLRESLGLINKAHEETVHHISQAVCEALTLRTSTLRLDDIEVDTSSGTIKPEDIGIRTRFALRFGDERSEDGQSINRADSVRKAFNSPFWPFVLVTTSVGQEGLDFHTYCHAVVHWNLPSNPVDLEQREGRVHRYKGHAIRKNLALSYVRGDTPPLTLAGCPDPWEALFDSAKHKRSMNDSDLIPYWIYCVEGGARIERHVPILPLSRDTARMTALKQSLAVYRMVFGQSRQEDLVSFLIDHLPVGDLQTVASTLRMDLSPPKYDQPKQE